MFPAQAIDVAVDAGVASHRLRERSAAGSTLVRETGLAPGLRARLAQPLGGAWIAQGALAAWATDADYDGRTQSGVPVTSRTGTTSLTAEAGLAWRPLDAAWRIEGALQVEHFRRRIEGAAGAAGLDERLTQPRVVLRAGWDGAAWMLRGGAIWGPRAPLSVRFDERLFDPVTLRSGRARGLVLEASYALAAPWRIGIDAEALDVGRSLDAALTRGASVVGGVAQPRWRRDHLALVLQRRLD